MGAVEAWAKQLAQARSTREYLTYTPSLAVTSVDDAYRIQAAVADTLGERVAGWKVGIGPDNCAMAAPVFTSDVVSEGGAFALGGDLRSVKVEAELALRLGHDLPPRPGSAYRREEILAATAAVFCGIELVATRFRNEDEVDFATKLADNFAHGAYCAGPQARQFAGLDLANLHCRVTLDEALKSDRRGGHPAGDPLAPVVAWASEQCDRLGGLRAGQFITTGTLIDPWLLARAGRLEAQLEGIGEAVLKIVQA